MAPAAAGTSLDIGGGESASLLDAMALVEEISGPMRTETLPAPAGDPRVTKADLQPTIDVLGWVPTTSLFDGLSAQASWHATQSDYDAVVERS